MKTCTKCKLEKELREFCKQSANKDGLYYVCRSCVAISSKIYKDKKKKKIHKQGKIYREKNIEKIKERNRRYYAENKERLKDKSRKWYSDNLASHKAYKQTSKYKKRRRKLQRDRYKNDPEYRLTAILRSSFTGRIKKEYKSESVVALVGCSISFAKDYLAERFTEGMSWSNHGDWHIDHIRPCASFDLTDPEQQRQCFHYTNLQPLWAADNIRKSDTYV